MNYPLLTKTNYNDWALLMKIKLQARCLWAAIEPDGLDVPLHEDRMALDAICSAVPPEMIGTLATKASAREAWECIKTMRVGNDRIRKASAQKVRSEYESLAFRGDETVEDFALRLTTIVNQLATLGDPEPADKVVEKYLRVARPRFNQLILSIETLLDISTLSMEEVTGRLKAAEGRADSVRVPHGSARRSTCQTRGRPPKLARPKRRPRGRARAARPRPRRGWPRKSSSPQLRASVLRS